MLQFQKRNNRRDQDIVFLREQKQWSFGKIGEKYGITRVRVRQLYMRMNEENVNKQIGIGA